MKIESYEDLQVSQKYIKRFENEVRKRELILDKATKAKAKAKEDLAKAKEDALAFINHGKLPKRMQTKLKKEHSSLEEQEQEEEISEYDFDETD